jgi:hypothetical protein
MSYWEKLLKWNIWVLFTVYGVARLPENPLPRVFVIPVSPQLRRPVNVFCVQNYARHMKGNLVI